MKRYVLDINHPDTIVMSLILTYAEIDAYSQGKHRSKKLNERKNEHYNLDFIINSSTSGNSGYCGEDKGKCTGGLGNCRI